MGRKRIFLYCVLSVVLIGSTAYLLFPPQLKLFYVIDSDHLSEVEPHGTWLNMTCPQCGSQLKRTVLDPDNPQIMDDTWMFAYYCRKEDMFWIADMPGFDFSEWYGPFDSNLRLTNTVAMCLVIISGVALVLLAIRDKGLIKDNLDRTPRFCARRIIESRSNRKNVARAHTHSRRLFYKK